MLYVANCTKQTWRFCFRMPETGKEVWVDIKSGQQEEISKGMSAAGIANVINHLERHGARDHADGKLKPEDFDGYLYSLNKPIHEDKIFMAHDVVVDKQEKRSVDEAVKSALGYERSNRDKKSGKRLAKVSEVEVIQDVPSRQKPTGDEVRFSLAVAEDGNDNFKLPH